MRLTRIYTPQALSPASTLQLEAGSAHHISRVLRMQAGAALLLFNGDGCEFHAQIASISKSAVMVKVGAQNPQNRAPTRKICLYQGLPRLERLDLIMQKAVELGAGELVVINCQHSQVKLSQARKKLEHWQQVIISASEQCWRSELMQTSVPISFAAAIAARDLDNLNLFFDVPLEVEGELLAPAQDLNQLLSTLPQTRGINIWIGPEGGFSKQEAMLAASLDFAFISLGKRILRTETAAISALAVCQALAGDLA